MNPVNIHQVISGKEFTTTMQPTEIVSYGCKRSGYALDLDERIHVLADSGVATLHCTSAGHRERLTKMLKQSRVPDLRLQMLELIAIKIVLFEKGWPNQSYRTIRFQDGRAEHGVVSYARSFLPPPQQAGKIVFLAPGHHPGRHVHSVKREAIVSVGLNDTGVVLEAERNAVWPFVNLITPNMETSVQLGIALKAGRVHTVEMNDQVRAIILSRERSIHIYGYDKLPKSILDATAKFRVVHRMEHFLTGMHSADRFKVYPYHEIAEGLDEIDDEFLMAKCEVPK